MQGHISATKPRFEKITENLALSEAEAEIAIQRNDESEAVTAGPLMAAMIGLGTDSSQACLRCRKSARASPLGSSLTVKPSGARAAISCEMYGEQVSCPRRRRITLPAPVRMMTRTPSSGTPRREWPCRLLHPSSGSVCVEFIGAIERDGRDAIGGFVGDLFVGHGVLYNYRNARAQASRMDWAGESQAEVCAT